MQCPNCSELNKIDSKFCVKCRMVLSYDSYLETVKEKESHADFTQRAMNTITVVANRMKRFEKLLIDSGIVDTQQALKLKIDCDHDSFKALDTNASDND